MFRVSSAQYAALEGDAWTEYDVRYVVPPFAMFALVVDEPRWEPAIDNPDLHARTTRLLVDAGESAWRIAERVEFRRTDAPDAASQAMIVGTLFDPESSYFEGQDESGVIAAREFARVARVTIGFCLLLQHRDVSLVSCEDPDRPPNRQQRRAAGYVDVEQRRIILRPRGSVERLLGDVRAYERLRNPGPQDVRGHVRTLRDGRVIPVKPYRRGDDGPASPVEYDARRLRE